MATPNAASGGSDFTNNLGRVYALYTGGFLGFVLFLAVLEQVGVPNNIIGYLFVIFTIGVYAMIGIMSRTMQVSEYYVAGRKVPAFYNGMATAADWMSAASFIGMAGTLYALGYDGLAFILGWTGGYVLVATLIAPYLRKFGCYTVPDFLAFRFGGNGARIMGIIVLMSCSFTYVVAQIVGTGLIGARLLGMSFEIAVFVGLVGILVCSMLGGMRAVTWTQVAQYIVLIVAYLVPVVILSAQRYGLPLPQLTYGQVLQEIAVREQQMVAQGLATAAQIKPHVQPFLNYSPLNYFGLILCLMVGTAALPHVLMRYFTTPSVREARTSVAWTLLFIFILYFTAPAYAAFAKLEVFRDVIGQNIASLPGWIYSYGKVGLVSICGKAAASPEAVAEACRAIAGHAGVLRFGDLRIDNDAIVISTPEIAGLPYVVAGLVAAGGLAAALSTADGLLLAIANALSHDVYYKMVNKDASTERRLIIARVLLVGVALIAAYVAAQRPADIVAMVAWAFSLAAGGLFPALVLGIWWKRTSSAGAVAGMAVGFGVTLLYLVVSRYYPSFGVNYLGMTSLLNPMTGAPIVADMAAALANPNADTLAGIASKVGWFNVNNISAALFGLPAGFLTMILVSLVTPAPSKEMQDFIDEIRQPKGRALMEEKTA
ncbi:MAG TPA: sodium:solute symporter family protein [Salinarimonas sp.]|nr:sodium:solute symporter family protein [Salinarimonas sp.]